jgi:hypothetical protein
MAFTFIEGPVSAIAQEDGFDEYGYPVQQHTLTVGTTTVTYTSRPKDKFLLRIGDHILVEVDPDRKAAVRCYAPYLERGVGKGWQALARRASPEHRYKLIHGTVKHKEINHVRADITRDNSWPGHYYRVVLTQGDDFLLAEKLGGGVKPGDVVQVLWSARRGMIAYRNITRGHRSGPNWTDWAIMLIVSVILGWMFFHFLALLGEPDAGKIFMLLLLGSVPLFLIGSLFWREYTDRRKLALLDERVRQAGPLK